MTYCIVIVLLLFHLVLGFFLFAHQMIYIFQNYINVQFDIEYIK